MVWHAPTLILKLKKEANCHNESWGNILSFVLYLSWKGNQQCATYHVCTYGNYHKVQIRGSCGLEQSNHNYQYINRRIQTSRPYFVNHEIRKGNAPYIVQSPTNGRRICIPQFAFIMLLQSVFSCKGMPTRVIQLHQLTIGRMWENAGPLS